MTTITTSPADPFTYGGRGGKQRMIPDETTGEMRPHQRVSTFANTLSDKGGLDSWKAWMALRGTRHDDGGPLMAQALHAERTPRGLIEQLAELGGSRDAATKGSNRHQALAMALTGADMSGMPPDARAELDAIVALIHGMGRVVAVEAATVCDEYATAGSVDLVLEAPAGIPVVADFKTGRHLDRLSGAIQLAAHARSRYWVDGRRGDWVAPTKPLLALIHAPQDGTEPAVHYIDPGQATRAAELAVAVREIRKDLR